MSVAGHPRRIHVLTTGGTIASRARGADVVANDGPDDLLAALDVPRVEVEARELLRVGSYRFGERELRQVAQAAVAATSDADGVVITHGTDTMEESAFLTDLVYEGDVPIVFCGAQRHADEPDRDGPRNLTDAVRLAAHPAMHGSGVAICMAGSVWPARYATKVHTLAVDGFAAPGGPFATCHNDAVHLLARPVRPDSFPLSTLDGPLPRVDVVTAYVGVDGALIRAAVGAGARGVVVAAFGVGNVTPALAEEIHTTIEAGIPVVLVSRTGAGPVVPRYGGPGGGAELARAGVILGGALRASHARLLLALALTTAAPEGVAEIVARHT